MDEMDTGGTADGPFDASLSSAITRIDDHGEEAVFDRQLTPAVRRIGPSTDDEFDDGGPADSTVESGSTAPPDVESLVGPTRRLEPRIQVVWILQSAVSATTFGLIASIAFAFLPVGDPLYGVIVFAFLFTLGTVLAILRYRIWRYEVRADSLYLRRGVVTRVTTVVPYVRIQHVDVRRGAIERTFGLATTVVYTAGSRGADVSIPGLTPSRADDLQARLKQLAIAAEGEDAV